MNNDEGSDRPSTVSAFQNKRVDFIAETKEKIAEWQSGRNGEKFLRLQGAVNESPDIDCR
jgi:hypothetical protein